MHPNRPNISDSATKVLAIELDGLPGRPRRADRRDRSYNESKRERKRLEERSRVSVRSAFQNLEEAEEEDSRRVVDDTDLGRHD